MPSAKGWGYRNRRDPRRRCPHTGATVRPSLLLELREGRLQNREDLLPFRRLVGIPGAPCAPVRPPVRDLVLDAGHERAVRVLVNLPDPLVGQDVPVVLRARGDPGSGGRAALPLLDRREREVPPVRLDLALPPYPVGIDSGVLPADAHPRVRPSAELLEIVVGHTWSSLSLPRVWTLLRGVDESAPRCLEDLVATRKRL